MKKPRRGPYPIITVDEDNRLWGSVNGHQCRLLLDSGTTMPIVFMPLALKLGLVTGGEETKPMVFDTWSGLTQVEVIPLQEVVIVLEGGVEVHTPATVFPESMGEGYDMKLFVLDVNSLRRGDVVQRFHRGGSSLVIRRPEVLRRVPEAHERRQEAFTFKVRRPGHPGDTFLVLLDTGCTNFSVSRNWKRMFRPRGVGKLRHVFLQLGEGCCLHVKSPKTVDSSAQDMVMGCKPLRQYAAVVDYGDESIYFKFGSKRMKFDLMVV